MMTRKLLLALVLYCCTVLPAAAGELKIGYVDMLKAVTTSVAGKAAAEKLSKQATDLQASFKKREEILKKQEADLGRQMGIVDEVSLEEKVLDLENSFKIMQRDFNDAQQHLQRKVELSNRTISQEFFKVVEDFGKREGFTMILEKNRGGVLFADPKLDVTDSLIKAFDATQKK